jgi:hypothetical protein
MLDKKPKNDISAVAGNFYWVRPTEKEKFEPTRCDFYGKELYFFFTNGMRMGVKSVWEYEDLIYTVKK